MRMGPSDAGGDRIGARSSGSAWWQRSAIDSLALWSQTDFKYLAGARTFPALVPTTPQDSASADTLRAWAALGKWQKPFLTLFGKNDPILGRADVPLQRHVPGSAGEPHERLWGGHFVQEDRGDVLAAKIIVWLSTLANGASVRA